MKIKDFLKCEHDIDMNTSMTSLYCVKCGQDANVIKLVGEQLEIIKFYASIENYDFRQVGTTTYATKIKSDIETSYDMGYKLLVSGKKAREYLQRMESKK